MGTVGEPGILLRVWVSEGKIEGGRGREVERKGKEGKREGA